MIIRITILITVFSSLVACNETQEKSNESEVKKTYEQLVSEYEKITPKNDTIALGFILRQPEKDIFKRFDQLKREGKLKDPVDMTFAMTKFIDVHPYTLIVDELTRLETFVGYNTYKGKLASLTFFGDMDLQTSFQTFSKLLEWMKKRFGEITFTQTADSRDEYYWFDGYKQIQLVKFSASTFVIEYNDVGVIAQKKRDEGILLTADSLVKKYEYEKSKDDIK